MRASTAPSSSVSRCTGRPVATTESERVVGMPRACIASLTMYSRSIGPTAARPSPPRANGRATRALEMKIAKRDRGRRRARRAAVHDRRRGAAPNRRTDDRRSPARRARRPRAAGADEQADPSGLRSQSGSSPSSVASGSLRTSSRGAGVDSACQRTASSGSSRANRLPRTTVVSGAILIAVQPTDSVSRAGA